MLEEEKKKNKRIIPEKLRTVQFSEVHYSAHNSPPLTDRQYTLSQLISVTSILITSSYLRLGFSGTFPSGFPHQNPVCISVLPHAYRMSGPPPPRQDCPKQNIS